MLVADHELAFARRLAEYFFEHGFEARVTTTVAETKQLIEAWTPDTVFLESMLPDGNAIGIFKFLNSKNLSKVPKVIVMSSQSLPQGVEQMREAGASHYLVKPFSNDEAFRAVSAVVEQAADAERANLQLGPGTIKELHLLNLFLKQATTAEADEHGLYNLMRMINLKVKAVRSSLIQVRANDKARVLASNDDQRLSNLEIDLNKYPEVREVARTHQPVIVPNVRSSELMADVGPLQYETIMVFPVFRYGTFFGALSLRMEQRDPIEIFYVEKFGQVCSQILGLAIGAPGQRLVRD